MNMHFRKGFAAMAAAKPASGFRPETPEEWAALQDAAVEFGYAFMRDFGLSHVQATDFAKNVFGGAAGRLIMDIALSEDGDVKSRN